MFLISFAIILVQTKQFPIEYKGWTNNCSFYFQQQTTQNQSIEQQFQQCHVHVCSDFYLMNCDKYVLQKKHSLAECMKLCCNQQSQYHYFNSILDFLSACEIDFMNKKNKVVNSANRLPLKVLFYTLLGLFLLLMVCIAFAYSDQILQWGRERLSNRNRNDAGIQLRNFIN